MNDFKIIFRNELKSFVKSTKSTLFLLFLVSFFWGLFLSVRFFDSDGITVVWLMFFALVASAGFANASFVRERLGGSWEILLASGISRKTIFAAKLLFVQCASFVSGAITFCIAFLTACLVRDFVPDYPSIATFNLAAFGYNALIFFCAAFTVNVFSAYFTLININQRAVQLINLGSMSLCAFVIYFVPPDVKAYELITVTIIIGPSLPLLLLIPSVLYSDKVIQTVSY